MYKLQACGLTSPATACPARPSCAHRNRANAIAVAVYRTRSAMPFGRTTITAPHARQRYLRWMKWPATAGALSCGGPQATRSRSPWPTTTSGAPKGELGDEQHGHLDGRAPLTVGIDASQDLTSSPKHTICVVLRFLKWVKHNGRTPCQVSASRFLLQAGDAPMLRLPSRRRSILRGQYGQITRCPSPPRLHYSPHAPCAIHGSKPPSGVLRNTWQPGVSELADFLRCVRARFETRV
jgi:hypothetical protein